MCIDPCGTANLTPCIWGWPTKGNAELNICLFEMPNDFLEKGKEQMRTGWVLWPSNHTQHLRAAGSSLQLVAKKRQSSLRSQINKPRYQGVAEESLA